MQEFIIKLENNSNLIFYVEKQNNKDSLHDNIETLIDIKVNIWYIS